LPAQPPFPRGWWKKAALAVGVAATVVVTPIQATAAPTAAESRLLGLINGARDARGLAPLAYRDAVAGTARRHSLRMAREGELFHRPCLTCRIPPADLVGENVGMAGSLRRIHRMMMRSGGHRHNILGNFDVVGVGVVKRGGRFWVTEIFLS
jgi:uncharacterized protein YkwD